MRTCTTCKQEKTPDCFYKEKRVKDGLQAQCKECKKKHSVAWQKANRDKVRVYEDRWRSNNPEAVKAMQKRYYQKHREKLVASSAMYRQKNPDIFYAAVRRWKKENIERVRELNAESKKRNPHTNKAYKQRRRANQRNAAGARYTKQSHMQARWDLYGGRCYYCGEAAESFDHRIPLARGGSHWPANLVPCCMPCNTSKNRKTEAEFLAA